MATPAAFDPAGPAQIADLPVAVQHHLVECLRVGFIGKEQVYHVVAPDIELLILTGGAEHIVGERLVAFDPDVNVFGIRQHPYPGMDFRRFSPAGDHPDRFHLLPGSLVQFAVHGDLSVDLRRVDRPETAVGIEFIETFESGDHRAPQLLPHELNPFQRGGIGSGQLFGFVEQTVDAGDLSGGIDLRPELVLRGQHSLGADPGLLHIGHDILDPVPFQRVVELLHRSGGGSVHQTEMLVHQRVHVGGVVPQNLAEDIEVHGVEDPDISFGFQEGAEGVGRGFAEEFAYRLRGEGGNVRDLRADLGGVRPQICFRLQLFVPVLQQLIVGLLRRIELLPRARDRQHHDYVGRDVHGRDLLVGVIGHDGDVTGDLFLLQTPGNVRLEFPDHVAVPLGIFGRQLLAGIAPAVVKRVIGHDVEERLAEQVLPPDGDPAGRGRLPGEKRLGVLVNDIFQLFVAEAEMPVFVVRAERDAAVVTLAVVHQCKIFGMILGEAFGQLQTTQTVAVGNVESAFPHPERGKTRDIRLSDPLVKAQFSLIQRSYSRAVGAPVLAVRTVHQVDGADLPVRFGRDNGSDLAWKVEADAAEPFQKFVHPVQRPFFPGGSIFCGILPRIVGSGYDDVLSDALDHKAVPVDGLQIDARRGSSGIAQQERGLPLGGRRGHGHFRTDDLSQIFRELLGREFFYGTGFFRDHHLALRLAAGGNGVDGILADFGIAGTDGFRIEAFGIGRGLCAQRKSGKCPGQEEDFGGFHLRFPFSDLI